MEGGKTVLKVRCYLLCMAEVADLGGVRYRKCEGQGRLKAYISGANQDDQI